MTPIPLEEIGEEPFEFPLFLDGLDDLDTREEPYILLRHSAQCPQCKTLTDFIPPDAETTLCVCGYEMRSNVSKMCPPNRRGGTTRTFRHQYL